MVEKQTPEERIAYLKNEKKYLEARIRRLKDKNKKDPRDPELVAWYLTVAEDNLKKIKNEIKTSLLQSRKV
jgi:hypothetical protein